MPHTAIKTKITDFISQNVRGLKSKVKTKELCNQINNHHIFAACIQETWLNGDSIVEHDNCTFIQHGIDPSVDKSKRGKEGVAIVLSHDATKAWNASGRTVFNNFGSRILAVRLNCQDARNKNVSVYLVTAYAPIGVAKDTVWREFLII